MLNSYETVFILTPVLSDVQMKETVEKFRNMILESGGEIVNDENWGLRKLAYPIQKKSTGFYNLLEFKAEPSFIESLEVLYGRDRRGIRFLTFKLEKNAFRKVRKRRTNKKEKRKNKAREKNKAEIGYLPL